MRGKLIFNNSSSLFCCSPAVCCLTLALTICVVPDSAKTGVEQSMCEVNRSFSLKELIMKWLLLYQLEEDFEDSTELPPVLHRWLKSLASNCFLYLEVPAGLLDTRWPVLQGWCSVSQTLPHVLNSPFVLPVFCVFVLGSLHVLLLCSHLCWDRTQGNVPE